MNIQSIRERIRQAAERSGQREEIKLVAVTKNVLIAQIEAAIEAGITDIGENKAQEALKKFKRLGKDVTWHFVGYLQRNKVKLIIDFVDLIHSVDRLELVEEIEKRAKEKSKVQDLLVQVNIAREETKSGIKKEEAREFLKEVSLFKNVRVKGLMNIAPFVDDPREVYPVFAEMRALFEDLKKDETPGIEMKYLSMGMTHDFEVAIEAGANVVRIGTGIFGDAS